VYLGLGPDGHTASLFPQSALLTAPNSALVAVVTDSPKPPPIRLTFTLHLLNQAAEVIFMADGPSNADAVRAAFDPGVSADRIPAKAIRPAQGTLTWLLDPSAASQLPGRMA
jgi:6-phosphogluconolactonase